MSFNGDKAALRNGRSPSEISIYNYPEHLNPFYEDDQHKRLRFWKIPKNGTMKRIRNSLSIESLQDIWSLKSFSSKKKSSTLGINKTSESPPIYRRNFNDQSEPNSSRRERYYNSVQGSPALSIDFTRRTPYRSSLQHIDFSNEANSERNDLIRNGQCRRTTQFSGLPTSQMRQSIRSSQTSLASTNPFESDIESDFTASAVLRTGNKTHRKKRKAPLPPNKNVISNDGTESLIGERSIASQRTESDVQENINFKTLTTEIEQFVNISNESSMINNKPEKRSKNVDQSPSKSKVEKQPSTFNHTVLHIEENPSQSNAKKVLENTTTLRINESGNSSGPIEQSLDNISQANIEKTVQQEHALNTSYNQNVNTVPLKKIHNHEIRKVEFAQVKDELRDEKLKSLPQNESEHSSEHFGQSLDTIVQSNIDTLVHQEPDLRFGYDIGKVECIQVKHESKDEKPKSSTQNSFSTFQQKPTNTNKTYYTLSQRPTSTYPLNSGFSNNLDNYGHLNAPLKIIEKNCDRQSGIEKNNSSVESNDTSQNKEDENKSNIKRKSVKDIIDSINRSQRLLAESAAKGTHVYSTSTLYAENNIVNANELNSSKIKSTLPQQVNNILHDTDECAAKSDNSFRKCKINKMISQCRESSPTASNLDWNPVPKPKRSING